MPAASARWLLPAQICPSESAVTPPSRCPFSTTRGRAPASAAVIAPASPPAPEPTQTRSNCSSQCMAYLPMARHGLGPGPPGGQRPRVADALEASLLSRVLGDALAEVRHARRRVGDELPLLALDAVDDVRGVPAVVALGDLGLERGGEDDRAVVVVDHGRPPPAVAEEHVADLDRPVLVLVAEDDVAELGVLHERVVGVGVARREVVLVEAHEALDRGIEDGPARPEDAGGVERAALLRPWRVPLQPGPDQAAGEVEQRRLAPAGRRPVDLEREGALGRRLGAAGQHVAGVAERLGDGAAVALGAAGMDAQVLAVG